MKGKTGTGGDKWSRIPPESLKGRLVQISLDKYELAGPHLYIPPLLVSDCVSGTHRVTGFSKISFLGAPQGDFQNLPEDPASMPALGSISFYNSEPSLQPQFLTDPDFVGYLNAHHYYVPVRVFSSPTPKRAFHVGEEADSTTFSYLGWGIVQVFEPRKGFPQSWRQNDPWLKRLQDSEKRLLNVDSSLK